MQQLLNFDEVLAQQVRLRPEMFIPSLEKAIQNVYRNNYHDSITDGDVADIPDF